MKPQNSSFWNQTATKPTFPPLKQSLETEILIIGGGITGVTCAYVLSQMGKKPVLIEAGALCDGTTGNTTGKVTIQHGAKYSKIFEKYDEDFARQYAASQTEALEFVKNTVKKESINCNLAENTAFIYASAFEDFDTLEKEHAVAKKIGIDSELTKSAGFPPDNFGLLGFHRQAVFHSVRYVSALAEKAAAAGARIFCDTKAIKVEDGDIKTVLCENDIVIKTKHLVMATQYPIYDGPNLFFTRLYANRDYGIAVETTSDWPDGSYINTGDPTRSIRTHIEDGKRILIVVGENHATGREPEKMGERFDNLIEFAGKIAGVNKVLAKWSAQDYDTPDGIPYIGRISDHSDIYAAAGFGKWGLTNGTLSGILISEMITTGNCHFEELYSRKRADYTTSLGKAIGSTLAPVGELIKSKLEGTEDIEGLERGEGRVIRYNGEKAGIYRDFDDNVIILDISCTHMSTELNFNTAEKTWDCPAHGGRYSADGKLLEGPPKHSLKVLFRGKYSELTEK